MRFRPRPTIGNAIFALAAILIALMAIVATINAVMSMRVGERIATLSNTFVPVYGMLARAHIRSVEQSLSLRQAVIARLGGNEDQVAALLQSERAAGTAVEAELAEARATVAREVASPQSDDDRLEFGRLDARIELAEKDRERYRQFRIAVDAALTSKDTPALLQGLERLDAMRAEVNSNLEQTRLESLAYARGAVRSTQETGTRVIRLTFIALAIAVVLGLLMATLVMRRLLGSFRHHLAATEAAERGQYDSDVPVNTQDEVGRLSRAFNQMLAELRLKQRIQDTFGRYVDPKVVKDLIDQPDRTGSEGDRRVMTVAFADMQGFTRLSEDVTPTLLVKLLNRYLTLLTDEVRARHGIVDKYIGDAVMSFWGPPFVGENNHPALACETGLAQVARFSSFRAEMPELLGYKRFIPRDRVADRHRHRRGDRRQCRLARGDELYGDGRCGECRIAAGGAEQGLWHRDTGGGEHRTARRGRDDDARDRPYGPGWKGRAVGDLRGARTGRRSGRRDALAGHALRRGPRRLPRLRLGRGRGGVRGLPAASAGRRPGRRHGRQGAQIPPGAPTFRLEPVLAGRSAVLGARWPSRIALPSAEKD